MANRNDQIAQASAAQAAAMIRAAIENTVEATPTMTQVGAVPTGPHKPELMGSTPYLPLTLETRMTPEQQTWTHILTRTSDDIHERDGLVYELVAEHGGMIVQKDAEKGTGRIPWK